MNSPFIVAEFGGNHHGDINEAMLLIDSAWQAGADAVKFQCFTPEQMAEPGKVIESGPWKGRQLLDLYRETHTPREWFKFLFAEARERGLVPFASVFHRDDVDFLRTLDCSIFKISSFEIQDLDLIRHCADGWSQVFISTGMARLGEIDAAVEAASYRGQGACTLLKCTSAYPAKPGAANLKTMADMLGLWSHVGIGLSDHTQGHAVATAAVALGAEVIEKHFTIRQTGPDAAFSLLPHEFAAMVQSCRIAAEALGMPTYGPTAGEESSLPLRRAPGGKRGG